MSTPPARAKAAHERRTCSASRTLRRGLDLTDAVVGSFLAPIKHVSRPGLTRSTSHRPAKALIDRRHLPFVPRSPHIDPKLLEIRFLARQPDVVRIARRDPKAPGSSSGHTVRQARFGAFIRMEGGRG